MSSSGAGGSPVVVGRSEVVIDPGAGFAVDVCNVRLDQTEGAFWLRIIEGAVPGREVEQTGAGERAGEIQQPSAAVADVQRGWVELQMA